jgi:hypothetical protein
VAAVGRVIPVSGCWIILILGLSALPVCDSGEPVGAVIAVGYLSSAGIDEGGKPAHAS